MHFPHFLTGLFTLLGLNFNNPSYVLDNVSLSDFSCSNNFPQSVTCFFIFLMVSSPRQAFLILMKGSLSIISLMGHAFEAVSKKSSS